MGDRMKKRRIMMLVMLMLLIKIEPVSAMKVVNCGGLNEVPYVPLRFVGRVINIIKVVTPIVLIIMGMVDMARATTANSEKDMDASRKRFMKRIVYAVMVFFVISVVQLLFSILQTSVFKNENNLLGCMTCVLGGECDTKDLDITSSNSDGSNKSNNSEGEKVTRVKIIYKKTSIKKGESYTVLARAMPVSAKNKKLNYKSSKTGVATISSTGKIKGKKEGTTTITVQSASNKSRKQTFRLTVKPETSSSTTTNSTTNSTSAATSSSIGGFTYYNQGDYKSTKFCDGGSTLQSSGCGAMTIAMVASNLVDNSYNPKVVANWLCNNGHGGGALSESWFTKKKMLDKFGLKSTKIAGNIGTNSDDVKKAKKQISKELEKDNMIILYIPGHYITLAKGKNGKVIVMDPGKRANNGTYTIDGVYELTKNYKNRCTSSNNCGWHGVYSFSKK